MLKFSWEPRFRVILGFLPLDPELVGRRMPATSGQFQSYPACKRPPIRRSSSGPARRLNRRTGHRPSPVTSLGLLACLATHAVQARDRDPPQLPVPLVMGCAVHPGDARQYSSVPTATRLHELADLQRTRGDVGDMLGALAPRPPSLPAWRLRRGCGRCSGRSSQFPALSPSTASGGRA